MKFGPQIPNLRSILTSEAVLASEATKRARSLLSGSSFKSSNNEPISQTFLKRSPNFLNNVFKILKITQEIKFSISLHVSRRSIRSEPCSSTFLASFLLFLEMLVLCGLAFLPIKKFKIDNLYMPKYGYL